MLRPLGGYCLESGLCVGFRREDARGNVSRGGMRKDEKKSIFSISGRGRIERPEATRKAPGGRGGEWGRGLLFGRGLALILCP